MGRRHRLGNGRAPIVVVVAGGWVGQRGAAALSRSDIRLHAAEVRSLDAQSELYPARDRRGRAVEDRWPVVQSPNRQSGSLFATTFTDLKEKDSFGLFAGVSFPLGEDVYGSTGVSSNSDGLAVTTEVAKAESADIASVGWPDPGHRRRLYQPGWAITYRAPVARLEAGVEQYNDNFRARGQVDGAVVFAGRDVFVSSRVDDAFAVVDAGAPDVEVQYENRVACRTNSRGKLLAPGLRSYEQNQMTIDPTKLPVNATTAGTREVTVPAARSGTVVKFDVKRPTCKLRS